MDRFWIPEWVEPSAENFEDTPRGDGYFGPDSTCIAYQDIAAGVGVYYELPAGWNITRLEDIDWQPIWQDMQDDIISQYGQANPGDIFFEIVVSGGQLNVYTEFPETFEPDEAEIFIAADSFLSLDRVYGLDSSFGGEVGPTFDLFTGNTPSNPPKFWSPERENLDGRTFKRYTPLESTFNFRDGYQNIFDAERPYKRFNYRPVEGDLIRYKENDDRLSFEEFYLKATNKWVYVDNVPDLDDPPQDPAPYNTKVGWESQEGLLSFEEADKYSVEFVLEEVIDD